MAGRQKSSSHGAAGADLKEIELFAQSLSEAFLACREMGHQWQPFAARYVAEQRAYERVLMCPRCTTKREQVLDSYGHPVSSQYKHAEGYLHAGHGRIMGEGRDVLRLESVTRFIEQSAPTAAPARKTTRARKSA